MPFSDQDKEDYIATQLKNALYNKHIESWEVPPNTPSAKDPVVDLTDPSISGILDQFPESLYYKSAYKYNTQGDKKSSNAIEYFCAIKDRFNAVEEANIDRLFTQAKDRIKESKKENMEPEAPATGPHTQNISRRNAIPTR